MEEARKPDPPVMASLSEDMDDMEIVPSRRNRKRALVADESQDSVGAMELEVSEAKPTGAMDKFVTKSQEQSETFKMNCSDPKNSE